MGEEHVWKSKNKRKFFFKKKKRSEKYVKLRTKFFFVEFCFFRRI